MGRSSQEQASQNRAKIVEKASSLFRKFGVENVSVADVMAATGMTTGGFYKHFASKEALVQEACALAFKQASASWHRISDRRYDDSFLRSSAIVEHYFQKRSKDQTCPILAFAPHLAADARGGEAQTTYIEGVEELFTQFLDHMCEIQGGNGADPVAVENAKVLFAAMVGAGLLAQVIGNSEWLRSVQDAITVAAKNNNVPRKIRHHRGDQ